MIQGAPWDNVKGVESYPVSGVNTTNAALEEIYRRESRRVFAALIRLLGDFDLAEEALHEAFRVAMERWPQEGLPNNPVAWLVSTGRFKAIDQLRRQRRFTTVDEDIEALDSIASDPAEIEDEVLEDDRLRLVFTCCHPSLSEDAQIALTLREICGLTTEQIAHAFLLPTPTLAQRIVRAKAKIRSARIPYRVPEPDELPARLHSVLRVVYLVFNEGYSASSGESALKEDLSQEAIRLGRMLYTLLPDAEVQGLLALMLLHESRRSARITPEGDLVPLDEQERHLWDTCLIDEGRALVEAALSSGRFGAYTLQAAISAVHAEAPSTEATDWQQIIGLYSALLQIEPSPVVELNRAVAIALSGQVETGLVIIDELLNDEAMQQYHLTHAARADLCRRLKRYSDARSSYEQALKLTQQLPERRFLERRLAALND